MLDDAFLISSIVAKRELLSTKRALLVGISGIDASGKGFITAHLAKRLQGLGWKVAAIPADDWLNLPDVCLSRDNPAAHFYNHALRLDEMFAQLIVPLKENRAVDLEADCADAKATIYRKHRYHFRDVDIILLEGIFLFRPAYRHHFDMTVWIDCPFTTALERAIRRGQEGLAPIETKEAFETTYFPAQRIHLAKDNPRNFADIILANDAVAGIADAGPL